MRKLLIGLASFFLVLSVLFTVLPLGTIAFFPVMLTVVFVVILFLKSEKHQRKLPYVLLCFVVLICLSVAAKTLFWKDEVVCDQQFEKSKVESKQEAKKDLEQLEGLE